MAQEPDRTVSDGERHAPARLAPAALFLALLSTPAGATAQTADQQVWIKDACPREIMGPGPWKRCTERNLQAIRAGLPDLTALASSDRAWIEDVCPREIMGPAPWKRCAERNLQAIRAGLPDLTTLASSDRAWIEDVCPRETMGPAPWKRCAERNLQAIQEGLPELDNSGTTQSPASTIRGEAQLIVEEITGREPAGHATADTLPDPPQLPAPAIGERWFCYTDSLSTLLEQSPEIVLTREGETDQPFGQGRVLVAGVIFDASFQIEGIDRRWDWNEGMDMISVRPGGDGAYFDFRLLEPGETHVGPRQQLWCIER